MLLLLLLLSSLGCAPPDGARSGRASPQRGVWTVSKLTASDAAPNDYFGAALHRAGDIDGDGLADIVIGAPSSGHAYAYYGAASGFSTADEQLVTPATLSNRIGRALGPGDFDGDGLDDLVVSAHEDGSGSDALAGAVALFAGSAAGLSSVGDLRPSTSTGGQQFSYDVAAADLNADGYDDIIISAHGDSTTASAAGGVYIYDGSSAGLQSSSEQRLIASDAAASDSFGFSLCAAGDIDADGYEDLIVGSAGFDPSGSAYVYYGSPAGLSSASEDKIPPGEPTTDSAFGFTVAGAGDVNSDGYADVMVATYDFFSQSAVYVYHGSAAGIDTTPALRLVGSDVSVGELYGGALAGAGDLDRDGYDDVVIGASQQDGGAGAAYIYYGSATGLSSASEEKLTTTSGGSTARFGDAVASGGDLNGDGVDDLLIGATTDEAGGSYGGAVYVYYGSCTDGDKDGLCALDDCDDGDPKAGLPLSFYADADADGYGDAAARIAACSQPSGAVADATDCDDLDAASYPGAEEVCDGADNDCDDEVDEGAVDAPRWYADADADGYGDPAQSTADCVQPSGSVGNSEDCDDADPGAYPGAAEIADDGVDQDCDGADLESEPEPEPTDTGEVAQEPVPCRGMGWSCATGPGGSAGGLVLVGLLAVGRRRRGAVKN